MSSQSKKKMLKSYKVLKKQQLAIHEKKAKSEQFCHFAFGQMNSRKAVTKANSITKNVSNRTIRVDCTQPTEHAA